VPQTYYEILGVSEHATNQEIEAAFKNKASAVHPDRVSPANPYLKSVASEAFKNLSEAKATILDPGKRQKYDKDLASSRGSGGADASASRESSSAAPAPASTPRVPRPFWWLVHAPSGLFTLGMVLAAILLAGGIALYRARPTLAPAPTPPQTTRTVNPSENPSPPKKESPGTASAYPANGEPRLPAASSKASKSQTIVWWRASEPPDLSALNPAERQAVESACSYAKLMESPDAYNGCLAKEIAQSGHRVGDQH
jgi:curved DNA-binding protein CbpA